MRAAAAAAAFLVTACAHVPSDPPVYACTDEVESSGRSVSSTRLIAADGRQLSVVASFTERGVPDRGFAIAASWFGSAADPDPTSQPVYFIFDRRIDDRLDWLRGVELRPGAPTNPAPGPEFVNRRPRDPNLSPSWASLSMVAATRQPLYLVQLGRGGELLRSEPIDSEIFAAAYRDVRASLDRSRQLAADPGGRCSRYGERQIVL